LSFLIGDSQNSKYEEGNFDKYLLYIKTCTNKMLIKIQPDATVCRYVFTAKSLYMFRVSQHPSSGLLKTVTATSGTGHTVK